ncbi:MAG: hypothetical protein IKO77_00400 [Bacteroidales bacterium]|nr:hypothetical protein [Bacteroidales bacterium]
MKKFFSILAIALAIPMIIACDKEKEDDPGSVPSEAYKAFELDVTFGNNHISFNQSGTFCAVLERELLTKAEDEFEYISGLYTVVGSDFLTFVLNGVGTLEVPNKDGEANIVFTPEGGNESVVRGQVKHDPSTGSHADLSRTWIPDSTIVSFQIPGTPEFATDKMKGFDLNAIEAFAAKNGVYMKTPFPAGLAAEYFAFFPDEYLSVKFKNGDTYVATVKGMKISAVSQKDLKYIAGSATAKIVKGKLIFTINARFENGDGKNVSTKAYITLVRKPSN